MRQQKATEDEQGVHILKQLLLSCELTCGRGYKAGRPPLVTVGEEDKESISTLLQSALTLSKLNQVVLNSVVEHMCCRYQKAMVGATVPNPLGNLVMKGK